MSTQKDVPSEAEELAPESSSESSRLTREDKRVIAAAYAALAEELSRGKPEALPSPPFDGALRDAVLDARRFVKNAKQRQIRRLAQLLQVAGSVESIRAALAGQTPELRAARSNERVNEGWRERLLAPGEGDAALTEFLAEFPSADRSHLRQLVRQASRTPADARSKKAATKILREIRRLRDEHAKRSDAGASSAPNETDAEP